MNSNTIQNLPEKWCIFRNNEHFEEIGKWFSRVGGDINIYTNSRTKSEYLYLNNSGLQGNCLSATLMENYTEITFEQFKKYVLKEEIVEEKVIEPLPQFKIIETIETITKVENNEGNQFFINDKIKVSLNMVQKIISFSYNEDKTEIFANFNQNLSISINDIEHYIEPKVEETLLDKAKRLYPIGTKFIPTQRSSRIPDISTGEFKENNGNIFHRKDRVSIFFNSVWAKIIEYPHGFKIGDRIKLNSSLTKNIYKINKIEGNVLFYNGNDKQYQNHFRILAKNAIKVN